MKESIAALSLAFLFFACGDEQSADVKTDTPAAPVETAATPPPAEFADAKYAAIGKSGLASLSSGDIDGWMARFADNAVYIWNNGDSIVGKPAITEYWKKRRTETIETITFTDEIWVPLKVNQPQSIEQPGVWLLGWYRTNAKYKTGKSMTQLMHTDYHFDANDKIDRVIQYMDRASINAASMK